MTVNGKRYTSPIAPEDDDAPHQNAALQALHALGMDQFIVTCFVVILLILLLIVCVVQPPPLPPSSFSLYLSLFSVIRPCSGAH